MLSRTRRAPWLVWVAVVALAAIGEETWAAVCEDTGAEAPSVVTVMASKTDPVYTTLIVQPDCTVTKLKDINAGRLVLPGSDIQRVVSVPTKTSYFLQYPHPMSNGVDLSSATALDSVDFQGFSLSMLDNLVLPTKLTSLSIGGNPTLTSIDKVKFPQKIESIYLRSNALTSLKGAKFPAALQKLWLSKNKISSVDLVFPSQLISLELDNNPISKLERVTFPTPLQSLYCISCGITVVRGVTWPSTLRDLAITSNPIVSFEIRQSDVALFTKLNAFDASISQSSCSDKNAILHTIKGNSVCVITDDRFAEKYGNEAVSPTSAPIDTKPSSAGSSAGGNADSAGSSGKGTGAGSGASGGGESNTTTTDSSSSGGAETTRQPVDADGDGLIDSTSSSSGTSQDKDTGSMAGTQSSRKTTAPGKSSGSSNGTIDDSVPAPSSSSTIVIVSSSAGGVFVLLALVFTCRKRAASNSSRKDPYADGKTPTGAATKSDATKEISDVPSQEYVANDVRNDRLLLGFRIELKDITVEDGVIARGGYGVIYRGQFLDRAIVMKQMLPGLWRDEGALSSFMDEIRLCASLDHAKIATFVGIAWSSLRDLSVVIEYMPGGDLYAVLRSQPVPVSPLDWLQPWGSAKLNAKKKIAQDIAEAVVYLHSFHNPILHRDLKAKNVLLDLEGNAKLSDFGISRELSVDETMTREVGTAAWIAPEILRGERYSEKADIYSLGVVLVEMDRCRHPYDDSGSVQLRNPLWRGEQPDESRASMSQLAHKNTQIALLVSTGKLRPSVTSACPEPVAVLVERCLRFDASERPTAMEAYYELRQIGKNTGSQ